MPRVALLVSKIPLLSNPNPTSTGPKTSTPKTIVTLQATLALVKPSEQFRAILRQSFAKQAKRDKQGRVHGRLIADHAKLAQVRPSGRVRCERLGKHDRPGALLLGSRRATVTGVDFVEHKHLDATIVDRRRRSTPFENWLVFAGDSQPDSSRIDAQRN